MYDKDTFRSTGFAHAAQILRLPPMNIETRIDRQNGLRTHVLRDEIKLSDIQAFLGKLYQADDFDPALPILWDVREAVFPEVSPIEVKELAYFVRANWSEKHRRKAAVLVTGDLHFGLSRMLEQFVGLFAQGRLRTFRDPRAAIEWIEGKTSSAPFPVIE